MEEKKKDPNKSGYEKYRKAIDQLEFDPVAVILRSHLLVECYLDEAIMAKLSRGDIVIDKKLNFLQKLIIVEALDVFPNYLIASLKNLNRIRNGCSHVFDYKISEADIDKIGRPFTNEYLKIKLEHFDNTKTLLNWTTGLLTARLYGYVSRLVKEEQEKIEEINEKLQLTKKPPETKSPKTEPEEKLKESQQEGQA